MSNPSVTYGGKRLIPAPFVGWSREFQTTEDGTPVGGGWQVTVKGRLLAHKGSPDSTGAFWTAPDYPPDEAPTADQALGYLLRKQQAIRDLFATEGLTFEVQSADGSLPLKCYPRVKRVDVPEGKNVVESEYTVVLEADFLEGAVEHDPFPLTKVSKAAEEWNLELSDEKHGLYRLTHSVSATGKRVYDGAGVLVMPAWQQAQSYVLNVLGLGLDATKMNSAVMTTTDLEAFNYVRHEATNELGGGYSVTESWTCWDAEGGEAAWEEVTCATRVAAGGRTTVTLEGTVNGLEKRDNSTHELVSTRAANAQAKFDDVFPLFLARAELFSAVLLHPTPLSSTSTQNRAAGTIGYTVEYDNRPVPSVAGALSQKVTVSHNFANDVFAQIPVLGRALGPVLQAMSTVTARKRTVNVEISTPQKRIGYAPDKPDVDALVLSYLPVGNQTFLDNDQESWDEDGGRYTRTTVYVWE